VRAGSYRVRAGSWREPWRIVSLLLVGGWLVGQAALIGVTYKNYLARDETALLGLGIPVARSMAAVLRVNCALVTLPVSRLLLTRLSLPAAAMSMHKMIGIAIAVQAAIHTVGHAFNFHAMSLMPSAMFAAHFPTLVFEEGKTPTVVQLSLLQLRGATGVAMVILFAVGMLAALPVVRSVAYERFELFHLATLPALVLLCVHGIGGVLESPSAWMYMVGPLAVLVVERLWRLWRAAHSECDVVDLWVPTNNVVEVTLSCDRPEFARLLRHGDYAYVAMPGDREWHPFCVVSTALEAPRVRLLIDRSGEWTRSLQLSLLNGLERLRLTGPYHSEGVAMTNFHTLVLCAGGTGVTPFCSLIGALVDNKDEVLGSVRRVVLLWSCRSDQHFLMLSPLLRRIADAAEPRVIVRLFATQQTLAGSKVERYEEDESLIDRHNRVSGLDVVTLGHSVELRRPDWSKELSGAVSNDDDTGRRGRVCVRAACTDERRASHVSTVVEQRVVDAIDLRKRDGGAKLCVSQTSRRRLSPSARCNYATNVWKDIGLRFEIVKINFWHSIFFRIRKRL
jgi:predicted ferric reductase